MVSINSKRENDFLANLHDSKKKPGEFNWFWVGAKRDENNPDTFILTDGSELDYANWNENEPNNQNNEEHCVIAGWGNENKWNDGNCNSAGYSVCEK